MQLELDIMMDAAQAQHGRTRTDTDGQPGAAARTDTDGQPGAAARTDTDGQPGAAARTDTDGHGRAAWRAGGAHALDGVQGWRVNTWTANSGGRRGRPDAVGYVMIGLDADIIVPLSRGDEHHCGRDALAALARRGLVPVGRYYPVCVCGGNYLDVESLDGAGDRTAERRAQAARVNDARDAVRRFLAWGGCATAPMMVSLHDGRELAACRRWVMTLAEFRDGVWLASADGTDNVRALDGLGRLSEYARMIVGLLEDVRRLYLGRSRAVFERVHALCGVLREVNRGGGGYGCINVSIEKIDACTAAALRCEASGDVEGVGLIVFGVDGIKNRLHNLLRGLCAEPEKLNAFEAWERACGLLFWGDARAALAEFDRLSA